MDIDINRMVRKLFKMLIINLFDILSKYYNKSTEYYNQIEYDLTSILDINNKLYNIQNFERLKNLL